MQSIHCLHSDQLDTFSVHLFPTLWYFLTDNDQYPCLHASCETKAPNVTVELQASANDFHDLPWLMQLSGRSTTPTAKALRITHGPTQLSAESKFVNCLSRQTQIEVCVFLEDVRQSTRANRHTFLW